MVIAENLRKRYGSLQALDNLSMRVDKGDIYGFIGPNGAGKSTTFKILATILKPDAGKVSVDGIDITQGDRVRAMIGYMPDTFGVYEDMTVHQYLEFFAAAYYIPAKKRGRLIGDILDLTDLAFKKSSMVRGLSRGMQQRLGVARVLIHDPKLLILDEPASGLDPRARIELRELLKELAGMGKTILISSHILSELSEICSRIGIIEKGRIVFEGARAELNRKIISQANILVETVPEDMDKAERILRQAPFCREVSRTNAHLVLHVVEGFSSIEDALSLLVGQGCRVRQFHTEDISLEKAFMALTKGELA